MQSLIYLYIYIFIYLFIYIFYVLQSIARLELQATQVFDYDIKTEYKQYQTCRIFHVEKDITKRSKNLSRYPCPGSMAM